MQFIQFETEDEQARWVSDSIVQNLNADELRHDDIVVINPDPITTREKVGPIRRRLLEKGINSHLAGVDTDPDIFFKSDSPSVTFTVIFRAKGNEAGMGYIINAHDCQSSAYNLSTIRNRLITAITRSKAWVRVLGVGAAMQRLIEEYKRLEEHNFELQFRYPTKAERLEMTILHRDVSTADKKRLKERKKSLVELVSDLESGAVHAEDIDEDVKAKLKTLLTKKS